MKEHLNADRHWNRSPLTRSWFKFPLLERFYCLFIQAVPDRLGNANIVGATVGSNNCPQDHGTFDFSPFRII
jgi:hypothetical protein